ncbi:hypothetical protein VOLCADRAFT_92295 [Volvox carteri f. nagariensis]|uniref:Pseudouridine synthase RsuA/RluA-like domain-containing protein n=1 Tax=Volvox carteri f. nagariensis TaxID=3068 RepID=D8TZA2_VOLCA|nr:uncharacterized protein VOLCADRAFT_92295 [Volvox carteri f. nagariensis]EFJ47242.1 hypothetical protein VOLCADRAFT_92295 [Volvox carteri f. nagariensis]|eukprot:XP_002951791.1 hypothetical protein VOLCADRAFT_92295 [Volvox carteri f. nagariensis]
MQRAMVVVAQAHVPPSCAPSTPLPLPELLQLLLPEHLPSATAAKRAIRRRLVLRVPATHGSSPATLTATVPACDALQPPVAEALPTDHQPAAGGVVLSTSDTAAPGDVLQLLARRGTGFQGWVGPPGTATVVESPSSSAAAAAATEKPRRGGGSLLHGLPVAYEDDHLAVVIKPPGIATQGSGSGTVQGRLKYCLRASPLVGALNRPQQVHRLDAPTGGLLLVAKTHAAQRRLAGDLHHRRMAKRYCTLVKGERYGSGTIDMPLSGKPCLTSFRVVSKRGLSHTTEVVASAAIGARMAAAWTGGEKAVRCGPGPAAAAGRRHLDVLTKILLWPHTGRTHQLRKHMAYTGTPILGDPRYRVMRNSADPRVADGTSTAFAATASAADELDAAELLGMRHEGGEVSGQEEDESDQFVEGSMTSVSEQLGESDALVAGRSKPGCTREGAERDEEGEMYQPPADADWALAVAAAAAATAAVAGGADDCDFLNDGSPVSLCLWAVGLRFHHPVSRRRIEVDISEWADVVFDDILRRNAMTAAATATDTATDTAGATMTT